MTKKQLNYIIRHYDFDVNNKDIDYLYEISEKILSEEIYYSEIDDLKAAGFFYDLYEDFKEEFDKECIIDDYGMEKETK